MRSSSLVWVLFASLVAASSTAHAQTLFDVANDGTTCSTFGGEGISQQLVDVQSCLRPGQFVSYANASITATSSRVHLFAQASAAAALQQAAMSVPLMVNSGFRPLSDQYLLWEPGNCSVVATPGSSNHQSGRAVDVQNTVEARTALTDAGCDWFGASDAVHYDCPGQDLRSDTVFTFQRLYNMNNPGNELDEDGVWGPMTQAALASSPAAGFAIGDIDTCGSCPGGAMENLCGSCGPAPTEVCDGVDDEDCDGMVDEGLTNLCGTCGPAPAEVCDGVNDEDCDGMVDEGCGLADAGPAADAGGLDLGLVGDAEVAADMGIAGDAGPNGGIDQGEDAPPVRGSSCAATANAGPNGPGVLVLFALLAVASRRVVTARS